MTATAKTLKLNAFLSGGSVNGDSWRHPDNDVDAVWNFARYKHYAQTLERGKFHSLFFYDTPTAPIDPLLIAEGAGTPRWDPLALLPALAVVTERIGLIATASTSYNEPYNIARRFASIDHLSGGRAGWNVVTSTGGGENFNLETHLEHGARYERAHEFFDVVTGLWDSWADDAFILDQDSGRWADPSRLHVLDHKGKHFSVKGPLNAPRPVQGWPVIAQAGASDAGRDLAARVGEVLYTAELDREEARLSRADVRGRAARLGRNPNQIAILPGVSPFVAPTLAEAEDLYASYLEYRSPKPFLRSLSNYASLDVDLSELPFDAPVPLPKSVAETNSHKSRQNLLLNWIRAQGPTVGDLYRQLTIGGHRVLVGTPQSIADDFEDWFQAGAVDGFTIMFASAPVGIERFVDLVVPELQRRGLFQRDYAGRTFRENLGLPRVPNRFFPG